jgi:hypothetical protein
VRGVEIVKREAGGAPKHLLRKALREAVGVLRGELDRILDSECTKSLEGKAERFTLSEIATPRVEKLEEQIGRFEKLIDMKGVE